MQCIAQLSGRSIGVHGQADHVRGANKLPQVLAARVGITRGANAARAAVSRQLGRIDAIEPHPPIAAANCVPIDDVGTLALEACPADVRAEGRQAHYKEREQRESGSAN